MNLLENNMQQRKIDTEQAEIKTTTVEIKSLTVNASKMTLSVFRQIPEEPLLVFDEVICGFNLAGVPWGRVNYYWGDDKDHNGIHVLWLKGTELKRSVIREQRDDANSTSFYIYWNQIEIRKLWDDMGSYPPGTVEHRQAFNKYSNARNSYNDHYKTLCELDQLFIAV